MQQQSINLPLIPIINDSQSQPLPLFASVPKFQRLHHFPTSNEMQRIHGKAELLNLGVEALDTGTVGDVGTLTGLGVNKFKRSGNTQAFNEYFLRCKCGCLICALVYRNAVGVCTVCERKVKNVMCNNIVCAEDIERGLERLDIDWWLTGQLAPILADHFRKCIWCERTVSLITLSPTCKASNILHDFTSRKAWKSQVWDSFVSFVSFFFPPLPDFEALDLKPNVAISNSQDLPAQDVLVLIKFKQVHHPSSPVLLNEFKNSVLAGLLWRFVCLEVPSQQHIKAQSESLLSLLCSTSPEEFFPKPTISPHCPLHFHA